MAPHSDSGSVDNGDEELLQGIKSEWRWRGKTEQQIKDLQRTADEVRVSIDKLGTKIETLQLTLQAQVTKMVIVSGSIVWIGSIITSIIAGIAIKVFTR